METIGIILGISNIGCAIMFCLLSIPLIKGQVPMNKFYGIKFKQSYKSQENWYAINKYGGKVLMLWSIPLAILGVITFFLQLENNITLVIIIGSAPVIVIIPTIQSYFFARKL